MKPLSLFEGYGIEIEQAVVDAETLDVRPVVDELLREASGASDWVEDHDDGPIGWSNELVAHVVELKTNGPVPSFAGVADAFRASERNMARRLADGWGARLMPSGMHPWMHPARDTKLWPHEHGPVYSAYDRLFDCRRHGWANVQSVHLNLPFADEHEFERLHAASRLVLPLIPALAASSPIVEGRATGLLDNRLDFYRTNSVRVKPMTGDVIPEPIYRFAEYEERIFRAIDRELEVQGADAALLGNEWTNARGAIARFDRMAIEIRLIDAQECPASDLAVAAAVAGVVRALVEERWAPLREQRSFPTHALAAHLRASIAAGPAAAIEDRRFLGMFGLDASALELRELWREIAEDAFAGSSDLEPALQVVLRDGVLSERILAALGPSFGPHDLRSVYRELCDCVDEGRPFGR